VSKHDKHVYIVLILDLNLENIFFYENNIAIYIYQHKINILSTGI